MTLLGQFLWHVNTSTASMEAPLFTISCPYITCVTLFCLICNGHILALTPNLVIEVWSLKLFLFHPSSRLEKDPISSDHTQINIWLTRHRQFVWPIPIFWTTQKIETLGCYHGERIYIPTNLDSWLALIACLYSTSWLKTSNRDGRYFHVELHNRNNTGNSLIFPLHPMHISCTLPIFCDIHSTLWLPCKINLK